MGYALCIHVVAAERRQLVQLVLVEAAMPEGEKDRDMEQGKREKEERRKKSDGENWKGRETGERETDRQTDRQTEIETETERQR